MPIGHRRGVVCYRDCVVPSGHLTAGAVDTPANTQMPWEQYGVARKRTSRCTVCERRIPKGVGRARYFTRFGKAMWFHACCDIRERFYGRMPACTIFQRKCGWEKGGICLAAWRRVELFADAHERPDVSPLRWKPLPLKIEFPCFPSSCACRPFSRRSDRHLGGREAGHIVVDAQRLRPGGCPAQHRVVERDPKEGCGGVDL